MGAGCFRYGQWVKGMLYLALEGMFFLFFFGFGWPYLRLFPTLGTSAQSKVWDEAAQIYRRVPGDNSMLILLFSVLSLAAAGLFLVLWRLNLQSAYALERRVAEGRHVNSFREDMRTLLDERFHVTLLSLPMLSPGAIYGAAHCVYDSHCLSPTLTPIISRRDNFLPGRD